jgi:hypothetical protein
MDSLLDLVHTSTIFPYKPEWSTVPERDVLLDRRVSRFPGTSSEIDDFDVGVARRVAYHYACTNQERRYEIENFFCLRRGRLGRFWLPLFMNLYVLDQDIIMWDGSILIKACGFSDSFRSNQYRIYIEKTDGSRITRLVTAAVDHGTYEELTVNTLFIDSVAVDEVVYLSLILLCRFDIDQLAISNVNSDVSTIDLPFVELVDEYNIEVGS